MCWRFHPRRSGPKTATMSASSFTTTGSSVARSRWDRSPASWPKSPPEWRKGSRSPSIRARRRHLRGAARTHRPHRGRESTPRPPGHRRRRCVALKRSIATLHRRICPHRPELGVIEQGASGRSKARQARVVHPPRETSDGSVEDRGRNSAGRREPSGPALFLSPDRPLAPAVRRPSTPEIQTRHGTLKSHFFSGESRDRQCTLGRSRPRRGQRPSDPRRTPDLAAIPVVVGTRRRSWDAWPWSARSSSFGRRNLEGSLGELLWLAGGLLVWIFDIEGVVQGRWRTHLLGHPPERSYHGPGDLGGLACRLEVRVGPVELVLDQCHRLDAQHILDHDGGLLLVA